MHPFLFAGTHVSSALGAFHGGKHLVVTTTFVISELERREKKHSTAPDIIGPSRLGMCGVTSFQANPNPATFVHKVLEKHHFLMSGLCKRSMIQDKK